MRILASVVATLALGAGLLAAPALAQDKGTVGIAMPTKSSARWISDGNSMVEQFTDGRLCHRPAICRGRHSRTSSPRSRT